MGKIIVVGGGAAGMFAAITAAGSGNEVSIFEKNDKLGKKLFITGKGRCNITNACYVEELFANVVSNKKFLYSSFYGCTSGDIIDFFERLGVRTKVERGNRVFPESDHSSDVIRALEREMKRLGVKIHLQSRVKRICTEGLVFTGVELADGTIAEGSSCIIATGGLSYQSTGSSGDGYQFAKAAGHTVTELEPSLVPMEVKDTFVKQLQGLSLRNVTVSILDGKKELYQEFGEILFTHYGVSGPVILSASAVVGGRLKDRQLILSIDLKPALTFEQLDQRVLRDFEENKNRQFKNALGKLFPAKLIPVMTKLSGIDPEKKVNEITKDERQEFVRLIKGLTMTAAGLRDFNEAIITRGGVNIREIDPGTMASKKVQGLFFVGEVLDLDALTGGFNLQIAWSTAYAAGSAVN